MRRYLLVDDNRPLAENLAEILRDMGDEADVAQSGAEALECAQKHRYDAMLTDMRMPLMDGAELVNRVRHVDAGLPALLLTAYSGDERLRIARQEGLLAVLSKPVPVPQLLETLRTARRDAAIALVEDDVALCDNLCEALRARGFTAVAASSILEADRIGAVRPFAAVVDLKVPGGPYGEAMRKLAERFPGMPIVVITGNAEPPPLAPHAIFRKPFDTQALVELLEGLYRQRVAA
ncbi:MAG: response regulator [Myxococcota bacterium]